MSPVLRASERYRLVPLGNDNNNDTKKREYRTKAESLFEHERALLLSFSCPPDHSALSSFLYVFLASEYISPGSKRYKVFHTIFNDRRKRAVVLLKRPKRNAKRSLICSQPRGVVLKNADSLVGLCKRDFTPMTNQVSLCIAAVMQRLSCLLVIITALLNQRLHI
ncbi:hypothetical protein PV328_007139 [Microctonus aethiopoides]|uniref:Uncharacterized protein n=1 Tax=Microctonus aethiopoides TaxID=144406 RepID=A0AA39FRG4_9HYME|nr:hypothetical protein PV328_007139 [Microctonus aethiopoides]